MTAEYLTDTVTLYEGDCLDVLPTLPKGIVDAVITDPPYGVGFRYSTHDDSPEGYADWCREWFAECRIACPGPIAISCGMANIWKWPQADWVVCWHKPAAMGRCAVGFNNWEPVLLYGKSRGGQTSDVFRATIKPDPSLAGHPCPKPLEWGRELLTRFTRRGDLILEPFGGSGTVAIAAMLTGRKCIVIEKDPGYCEIVRKRVRDASGVAPGTLFHGVASLFDN